MTGPTGPLITANNATVANTGTVVLAGNASVPFTTTATLNGTAITHAAGSTDILLAPNQTYFATWNATAGALAGGTLRGLALFLNGTQITGSINAVANSAPNATIQPAFSGSAVFNTGIAPNILTLTNVFATAATIGAPAVSVIKLI
ncbi:hypothetical protein [Paenibacillus arenosi]|uniref:BclA C-terminal domain-containing protein n=1 Tax=Paenibacillus arenosi TaxID=2774142 RepID=A0ABR9AWV0_9BACL|nr:hypothetical protein [Paenibacillus arenosi]MBD8497436.1 hypothetical protein [Paenibacillus arenosi]